MPMRGAGLSREQIKAYAAKSNRGRLRELQRLALVHYDHPDYKDEWWPTGVERWKG